MCNDKKISKIYKMSELVEVVYNLARNTGDLSNIYPNAQQIQIIGSEIKTYEVVPIKNVSMELWKAIDNLNEFDKRNPELKYFDQMVSKLLRMGVLIIDSDRVNQGNVSDPWKSTLLFALVPPVRTLIG